MVKLPVLLITLAFSLNLISGASIRLEITDLGTTGTGEQVRRLTYLLDDVTLLENYELDFRFDPDFFLGLQNWQAPSGFDVLVYQPNDPLGAFGDFTLLALVDNPPLTPISIDAILVGNSVPSTQPFKISEFDSQGRLLRIVETGTATNTSVPEPSTLGVGAVTLACILGMRRRRVLFDFFA
jgi:hypothetical protein